MSGLRRICKAYGGMRFKGADGKEVVWVWDYRADKPRLKSEMDAERKAASEKAKWEKAAAAALKAKQGDIFE